MPAASVRLAAWPQEVTAPLIQRERDAFLREARSMFLKAREHLAAGDLESSWAVMGMILNDWLRHQYLSTTGKPGSRIADSEALLQKLRAGAVFDKWHFNALKLCMDRPPFVSRRHVTILSGIIAGAILCDIQEGDAV